MKTLIKIVVISLLLQTTGYAEQPANIVYNNGPVAGSDGTGALNAERLRATEKDLERMTFERNIAVKEMNYRIKEDESRISPLWYIVGGIVAGGAAGYFLKK